MSKGFQQVGFIGLGVMGEPMCRNLAVKSGVRVVGYDRDPQPLERLAKHGVVRAASAREAAAGSDAVLLCLPSGEAVRELAHGADGLLAVIRKGQVVIDLSTSSVKITRKLHEDFASRGATFVDAPIA